MDKSQIPKANHLKRCQRPDGGYDMVAVWTMDEVMRIVAKAEHLEREKCISLCRDEAEAFQLMGLNDYRYGARSCMESLIATAEHQP